MASIHVAVLEDRELTQLGLHTFLKGKPEYQLVGMFTDLSSLISKLEERPAQVLILDNTLPGMDTCMVIRKLAQRFAMLHILVYGSELTAASIHDVIDAGASGCISKAELLKYLEDGIHHVLSDMPYFSPQVAALVCTDDELQTLSKRSRQVLQLLAKGLLVPEIARQLAISEQAVYHARRRLRKVLNVRANEEIVPRAQRLGLIKSSSGLTDVKSEPESQ